MRRLALAGRHGRSVAAHVQLTMNRKRSKGSLIADSNRVAELILTQARLATLALFHQKVFALCGKKGQEIVTYATPKAKSV